MNGTARARLEKCWWQKNNIKLSTRLTFTHLPRRPPFGEKYSITMRLCSAPEKKKYINRVYIFAENALNWKITVRNIFVCKIIPSCIGIKAFSSAAAAGDFLLLREGSKSTLNLPSAAGAVFVANYTRGAANECPLKAESIQTSDSRITPPWER